MNAAPSSDHATEWDRVLVQALMSTPVLTIGPEATLAQARTTMQQRGVHHLLVRDRGRIVAILSDRDIAHRLNATAGQGVASRRDDEAMQRRVIQVATFEMVTIPADASVEDAAARILEHGVSALPVVDETREIVGIVTTRDLLRGLLACVLPGSAPAALRPTR